MLLNGFLNSLAFLGYLATELGINIQIPPAAMGFLGELLGLINFDLLSEWSIFDIDYMAQ